MSIDSTAALYARALDGLYWRHVALAHNVANAGSGQHTQLRVSFEQALAERVGNAQRLRESPISVEVRSDANGTTQLDQQIFAAHETAARFSAVLSIIGRHAQLRHLALTDGRGR